jgi:hypothetical protein
VKKFGPSKGIHFKHWVVCIYFIQGSLSVFVQYTRWNELDKWQCSIGIVEELRVFSCELDYLAK